MFGLEIRDIILTMVTAIAGAIGFLIRKIFTSERQIELLKQSLMDLKESREDHDSEINSQLSEIRHDIKNLLMSRPYPRPPSSTE